MILRLRDRQLDQSFSVISDLSVESDAVGRVEIKLRAFGSFSPNCLDGMRSEFELGSPNGTERIGITLYVKPHTSPRGTWFSYETVFDRPGDAQRLVFTGVHIRFSNVRRLSFLAEGRPIISIANPFYRI